MDITDILTNNLEFVTMVHGEKVDIKVQVVLVENERMVRVGRDRQSIQEVVVGNTISTTKVISWNKNYHAYLAQLKPGQVLIQYIFGCFFCCVVFISCVF